MEEKVEKKKKIHGVEVYNHLSRLYFILVLSKL